MENLRQRGNEIGSTGKTVAQNIARVRKSQQISLKDLEDRLTARGRKISVSGLSKIENEDRRVEVDDLMAIALCLEVSPLGLLLPWGDEPDEMVDVTGGRGSSGIFWLWAFGDTPFNADARSFQARSFPWWVQQTILELESSKRDTTMLYGDPGEEPHELMRFILEHPHPRREPR